MKHVASVAGRELRGLFLSPIAYGVLALFSVLAGLFFILNLAWFSERLLQLQQFQQFEQLEALNLNDHLIREFYGSMSVVLLLFLVPGVTMGLFASEKTNGRRSWLLTSRSPIWDTCSASSSRRRSPDRHDGDRGAFPRCSSCTATRRPARRSRGCLRCCWWASPTSRSARSRRR